MTFLRYRIITLLAVATGANNCPNDHGLRASPTTVPFELRNDVPLVHARVNGVEFLLVLDSGSGSLVLDYAAAREAHIRTSSFGIPNSRRPVGRMADSLNLGAAVVHDAPIAVANMAAIQRHFGFDVRGTIGYDLFERYVVTVDYPAKTITIAEPAGYHPDSGVTSMPIRLVDGQPVVKASIETRGHGVLPVELTVDLGSSAYAIRLSRPFLARHPIESDTAAVPIQLGATVTGIEYGVLLRLPSVQIGDVRFLRPSVALSMQPDGVFGDEAPTDGTIGAGILRQTRVTFDYAHGKVHLARIAPAVAGDSVDASGLIFEHRDSANGRWFVQELVPDSPAEAAGLRIGDELTALDGKPVSSLGDVRERLRQSGTTCVLVVRRGEATIQVVLQLRALV